MAATLTSAAGVLSLLDEPDDMLKAHALKQLNGMVDTFWAEIATAVPKIEMLHEEKNFAARDLAAVVASKVFYHLEELDDALKYALGAGDYFQVSQPSQYVETLIAKCIDQYIELRVKQDESKEEEKVEIDERLVSVVDRMFARCYEDGKYKQALGIALEARRLDLVKHTILQGDAKELLGHCFNLANTVVGSRDFRQQVLRVLVDMYNELETPDHIKMCQCLLFLDDSEQVATILNGLLKKDLNSILIAYQVAFDLHENQNQPFLNRVASSLPMAAADVAAADAAAAVPAVGESGAADAAAAPVAAAADAKPAEPEEDDDSYEACLARLKKILSGETPINLYLNFLYGHNHADLIILNEIKANGEKSDSVTHNATVLAHGFMHCGTTVDTFLRENLGWLSRANNWAKFTATASIGVIHKGHHDQSLKLLEPYLPANGQSGSPYQEGGALYALGLIHSQSSSGKTAYLLEALKNADSNEIVQHGASLGLGLTGMASGDMELFEALKDVVYSESAVGGEAAGLAMGLVLLGSMNPEAIEEMLMYARQTKHEKTIRGLGLGLSMIVYGREENADGLIEEMSRDTDPILRYGGMNAIAMAYCATANNSAIRRLLHVAVSDVSDDVRRAAVTALGFVLCNQPEQVPRIVSLLSESYNPHVRYGACMAVGIACAGSGLASALELLEPLTKDGVDYVRQGAFIAMSMVLIQHNASEEPKVKVFRERLLDATRGRGEIMSMFGAILGAGILDAGGRNVTISLRSPDGHKRMAAIVGLAIFPQYWYWQPMAHFLSLAFTPTAVIGLNKNLKMPKNFSFKSNAKPSLYAYPEPMVVKKKEDKKELKSATLSVTAKAKAHQKKKDKEAKSDESAMEVDEEPKKETPKEESKEEDAEMKDASEETKEEEKKQKKKKGPEPAFEVLSNPARVTQNQRAVLGADEANQRYTPVKQKLAGIVLLRDGRPEEEEEIVVPKPPKIGIPGISDDEPEPPADFEYLR